LSALGNGYVWPMTQVLIAVDESEQSLHTAKVAYDLFGGTASYTVVNVANESPMILGGDALLWGVGYPVMMAPSGLVGVGPRPSTGAGTPAADVDNAPIDAAMQVALDVATEADLPNPQVVGEVGDPAAAILQAARHHQSDVIVVGSHERSWVSRLFVPSVTGSIVRDADVPVLIVR
jgi:nucleotide-binding universal stress UspA family protein